jgi:hypothetical protein
MISETLIERSPLWVGLAPLPLLEAHLAGTLALAVTTGLQLGLFERLEGRPQTSGEVAGDCDVAPCAVAALMDAMAGGGYLVRSRDHYALTLSGRRWLKCDRPGAMRGSNAGKPGRSFL